MNHKYIALAILLPIFMASAMILIPDAKPSEIPGKIVADGADFRIGNGDIKLYANDFFLGKTELKVNNIAGYSNEFIELPDGTIKWNIHINREPSDFFDSIQIETIGVIEGDILIAEDFNISFSDAIKQGWTVEFSQDKEIAIVKISGFGLGDSIIDPIITTRASAGVETIQSHTPALAYITPQIIASCYVHSQSAATRVALSLDGGTTWSSTAFDLNKANAGKPGTRICSIVADPDTNRLIVAWNKLTTASFGDLFITQCDFDTNCLASANWEIPYVWRTHRASGNIPHFALDVNDGGSALVVNRTGSGQTRVNFKFFNDANVAIGPILDVNVGRSLPVESGSKGNDISAFFDDMNALAAVSGNGMMRIFSFSWQSLNSWGGDWNAIAGCNKTSYCLGHIANSNDANVWLFVSRDFNSSNAGAGMVKSLYHCTAGFLTCSDGNGTYSFDKNAFGNIDSGNGSAGMAISPDDKIFMYSAPYSGTATTNKGYLAKAVRDVNGEITAPEYVDTNFATRSAQPHSCNRKGNYASADFGCEAVDGNVTTTFLQYFFVSSEPKASPPAPPPAEICNPYSLNNDWVVVGKCFYKNTTINLGTGSLYISSTGTLGLDNSLILIGGIISCASGSAHDCLQLANGGRFSIDGG